MSSAPRIVCLDCMRDCEVLYRDERDQARRADLARVRCGCTDAFVWVPDNTYETALERPVLLGECNRADFTQAHLEEWERLATQAMKRCMEVQRWFKETGR